LSRIRTGLVSGVLVFVLLMVAFGPLMTGAASESEILEKPLSTHLSSSASYEAPLTEWNRTFGGAGYDWAYSVEQASDGGYLIAGLTSSFGAGQSDVWLVKTDFAGNMEWNKTYGGADHDGALSVQKTSDNGYIVAGYTFSFGVGGSSDFLLIKIDAAGNTQWSKTFGGTLYDKAWSVQQTTDGGYVVAGVTESFGSGAGDFWLVKTDSSGNKQWDRTFGGERYEEAKSVKQTSDGGFIVAGWKRLYSYTDFWLVKTDASGYLEWDKTYGGSYDDEAYSAVQTVDGGYIIAGHLDTWYGGVRSWLVKTDSIGNAQWNQTYSGDRAYSVQLTSDKGYVFAGREGSDFLLAKIDSSGGVQWNEMFGGFGIDEARCVRQTSDKGYIVTGITNSFGAGSDDFWLIKLAPPEPIPVADFSFSPELRRVGEIVPFDASASYDRDGTIESYKWDFGDGNVTTVVTPIISHIYSASGTYAINLTVIDNDGLIGSAVKFLTAKLSSSITIFVDPTTVTFGSNVAINGSITPIRVGVNVTIYMSGPSSDSVTVKTDSNGNYSYIWVPIWAGAYEIRANWPGDDITFSAESEIKTVSVHEYVIYIRADGSVDPSTAPISTVDYVTYTFMGDIYAPPIVVERNNITIDGNGYTLGGLGYGTAVDLSSTSNVTIKYTNIKSFEYGIHLLESSNDRLIGNTVAHNSIGIWHVSSSNNVISENNITENSSYGIWLYWSSDNNIVRNNVTNNGVGIELAYSNRNTMIGNTLEGIGVPSSPVDNYVLYLYGSHNNTISNNTVLGGGTGILVGYLWSHNPSNGNTITNNNITNNVRGIWVTSGSGGNLIANNYGGSISLSFSGGDGNTLKGNDLTGLSIDGWSLSDYLLQNIDVSNTVNGKPVYYLINRNNLVIEPSTFASIGYLALVNSTNITVKNLTPIHGILLAYTTNSFIEKVDVRNSLDGIKLISSNNNTVNDNNLTDNEYRYSISVSGSGNSVTNNNIANNAYGVSVSGSYNILLGNNITNNSGYGVGLFCFNTTFSRNIVTNNGDGVAIVGSFNTINRNNITANKEYGILVSSSNNTISGNIIANNVYGVRLEYASFNVLKNNNMFENRYNFGIVGYWNFQHFINDVDSSNTVDGGPMYYWVNQHNLTVPSDAGYVALINSTSITVRGLNLSNNYEGILLAFTRDSLIADCNVTSTWYGISLYQSSLNTVSKNNLTNNNYGVCLLESSGNRLSVNEITNNKENGILIRHSDSNTAIGNMISNNSRGIGVEWYSNANKIFHNNFINNTKQAYTYEIPYYMGNSWDNGYPSGGNYWSDYTGVDKQSGPHQDQPGSDGIGDTPYFGEGFNGLYPFMNQRIVSEITVSLNPAIALFGANVTISGTLTPTRVGAEVTICFSGQWSGSAAAKTDLSGSYSYSWNPPWEGTFGVWATWKGDNQTFPAESETKTVRVIFYISISLDGSVDPPYMPIQRNGDLYTLTDNIFIGIKVERNNIVIDGAGYTLQRSFGGENGFSLSGVNNVTIKNININGFGGGIFLESGSFNNTITQNNIANINLGVYLAGYSNNNIVRNNNITNGYCGIYLQDSFNNNISTNQICSNFEYGIFVVSSFGNIFSGNVITNNNYSVYLIVSSNNIFYHNNFINNTQQVRFFESGWPNVWDDGFPSGGNYWSDYTGQDLNGDGIGDTPYMIDENNKDRYPLVKPWTHPTDSTPPATTISLSGVLGDNDWFTSDVSVTLSATDDTEVAKTEYSFNNTTWITYTAPFTITDEGETVVYYKSTDKAGNLETVKTKTIRIDKTKPKANAGTDQTVNEDTQVTLDASASTDENDIATYTWSFTDISPQTLSGKNPTYTFANPGVYTITLKVTDPAGNTATGTITITVLDITKPVANAGQDQTVNAGATVSFDASGSTDNVGIVSYEWNFGDGTASAEKTTTHTFATAGVFIVTLTVKDAAGNMNTHSIIMTAVVIPDVVKPVANGGLDRTVNEDTQITLDGSASSDDVAISAFTWTFSDVTTKTLTGEKPSYTFNTPGVYTITLNVTDAAGNWATDTIIITVLDITRPVANAGQDQTVNVDTTVSFDAGNSSDNVDIVSYDWYFGDGTVGTGKTISHTYATAGTYTVTLTVKDSSDNTASDSLTITVRSDGQPLPSAEAFPMWAISAAILALGIALATAVFLRKRRS